jgi:purine-binding chemotaxis protein CheW
VSNNAGRNNGQRSFDAQLLREAFDRAFAVPPLAHAETTTRLLGVRVAGDPYAIRVSELAGVTQRRFVPVPSREPAMAGLTTVRGGLWPVYRLRTLLGYPPGPDTGWLALVRADTPLALAFDEVDSYVEARTEEICALPEARAGAHLAAMVNGAAGARALIDVRSLIEELKRKLGPDRPRKES